MTNTLKQHVQNLHLSGLLNSLELRLQEAEANRLPHAQFLELLLQDEINVRDQRVLARRRKSADFREPRSLENFDFSFNPSINRAQIYELATSHFVRQHRDVLLVGPPGVGKSHLIANPWSDEEWRRLVESASKARPDRLILPDRVIVWVALLPYYCLPETSSS